MKILNARWINNLNGLIVNISIILFPNIDQIKLDSKFITILPQSGSFISKLRDSYWKNKHNFYFWIFVQSEIVHLNLNWVNLPLNSK